jgi:leishmanolysin-like peptidase
MCYQEMEHRPRPKIPLPRRHVDYNVPHRNRRDIQQEPVATAYEPIRIQFDTRLIEQQLGESDALDDEIRRVLNSTLPAAAKKWSQHLSVIPARSDIAVTPSDCLYEEEDVREIVAFSETDLVIIVGGDRAGICGERVLAYAGSCVLDDSLDRPIVGYIEFCLDYLVNYTLSTEINGAYIKDYFGPRTGSIFREEHLNLDLELVAIHELAHILGMAHNLFPYFRDETGAPRTPRDSLGEPLQIERLCDDGRVKTGYFPSEETIRVVQLDDGRIEQYMVTSRVRTIAQNHFNCPSLIGGRLQNSGGAIDLCVGSHWSERHLQGELLSPAMTDSSENVLSPHTLAVMEDSGWYQVDYRETAQLAFGNGAGCEFLEEPCIDIATNRVAHWDSGEFCDQTLAILENKDDEPQFLGTDNIYCDPAYYGWTVCDLVQLKDGSTPKRSYFSDQSLSPFIFDLADSCPIPDAALGLDCRIEDPYKPFYSGEKVGSQSRCVNAFHDNGGKSVRRPACVPLECDAEAREVRIDVGKRQVCTYNGELLPVSNMTGAYFVCPRLAAVCPAIYSCPDGCFGRGECIFPNSSSFEKPFCRCFDEGVNSINCAPEPFGNFTSSVAPTQSSSTLSSSSAPCLTEAITTSIPSFKGTRVASSSPTSSNSLETEDQTDFPSSSQAPTSQVTFLPSAPTQGPSYISDTQSPITSRGKVVFHFSSWTSLNAVALYYFLAS